MSDAGRVYRDFDAQIRARDAKVSKPLLDRIAQLEAELAAEREQRQAAETVAAIAVDPDAKLIVAAEARCKALEAALVNACDALRQEGLTVAHCAQVLTEADALLQPPPAGPSATGAQADE